MIEAGTLPDRRTVDRGSATVPIDADRLVRSALRRRWRPMVGGTLLATTHQASEAMVPVVIGVVIDRGIRTGDGAAMVRWTGAVVGLFVVLATAGLLGYYLLERAGHLVAHDVRRLVVRRVLDPRGGATGRTGEVMSLASSDADGVGESAFAVGLTIAALPAMVAAAVILLASSTELGLVVLVGVPVVVALVGVLARPLMRRAEEEQAAAAGAAGVITDLVHGLRVLKGVGAEATAAERYRRSSRAALAARLRSARSLGAYEAATFAVSGAFLVVVAWVGGRLAASGDITIGQLVAAVGLAQFLVDPLSMLIDAAARGARVRACASRVAEHVRRPVAVDDPAGPAPDPVPGAPALELEGVQGPGLDGVSLRVDDGEIVGVVTDPLAGGTLVDLLGRAAEPDGGAVRLRGVAVTDIPLGELRRRLVVARHDAVLFSGTIREQLVPADGPGPFAPPSDGALLDATAMTDVVDAVPGGLDAVVGDAGRALSGGQRQRLVLARTLATGAEVIVVHDPTTAVDATTEAAIAAGLRELRAGATTVVVTTSPALLAACDRVVVIDGGRVAAEGRHADLLATERYAAVVLG